MATCTLHGIGITRGYAIGKVTRLLRNRPEVVEYTLPAAHIEAEIDRFQRGLDNARRELRAVRERIPATVPAEITAFIDSHLLMLEDSLLAKAPIELIRSLGCNAEWALKIQHDRIVRVFEEMDDAYLRTRRDDVDHVVVRIQRALALTTDEDNEPAGDRFHRRIVVADDLAPADILLLHHQGVLGFVTEYGGPLSHTAILTRSLGLPTLVGVRQARRWLQDDETVVIDGHLGVLLCGLDQATIADYRQRQRHERRRTRALHRLRGRPAVTHDGVPIELQANIEVLDETAAAALDADGVGLFRTEFLFLNRTEAPDEDEQFSVYRDLVTAFAGRPVTIRTLDLGADKQTAAAGPVPSNPALGLRAIRLCLHRPELFRPQLRAILRASAFGPIRLMIPMLSSLNELAQVRHLLDDVKQELHEQGRAFDPRLPVGGMIEVPAAAICAPLFARQLDFMSIGTNDLIQYTLAIDRGDDTVNYLYDPLHPAVLRLIHDTLAAGATAGIPVSLCGEMAGDPRLTRLLLGLGLTRFSMHPGCLLEVKQAINHSHCGELRQQVRRLLRAEDPETLLNLLDQLTGPA